LADKLRIGVVSYLNSQPFTHGLELLEESVQVISDSPSGLADKLMASRLDLALVPVAMIPHLPNARIVSRYGIAADGPVKTVCLLSELPLEELDTIYLDYQSRTSVALVQLLFRDLWKQTVKFVAAYPGYESEIKGHTGGVVIGDRVIPLLEKFQHVYDLAAAWKQLTGLPFVFAAWVVVKELPATTLSELDRVFTAGLSQRAAIARNYAYLDNSKFSTAEYLENTIHYLLDDSKLKGLQKFLALYVEEYGLEMPEISVPGV